MAAPELLRLGVRAWLVPKGSDGLHYEREPPSDIEQLIVFDTEARTTPDQRLIFLVWRLVIEGIVSEEGIAYADGLDADETALLRRYAAAHVSAADPAYGQPGEPPPLRVEPLRGFLSERFYRYGCTNRGTIVGFNLPFDISRLASHWGSARGWYAGGFSLGLVGHYDEDDTWQDDPYNPRVVLRQLNAYATAIGFRKRDEDHQYPGQFVDCSSLAYALTGELSSLERACRTFGIDAEKVPTNFGVLCEALVDHCRRDVAATLALYRACHEELDLHEGIKFDPARLYSPGTVATAYLRAMGLAEPLEQFADLPDNLHAAAMCASYGGRAEGLVVREVVPVVPVDWGAMHPTIAANTGVWPVLSAEHLTAVDVTSDLRALLAAPDLVNRLLDPGTWSWLGTTLVEVAPHGDVLVHRARYRDEGDGKLATNPLSYDGALWWAWPDVAAATVLGGSPPEVLRAIRLEPAGPQPGLLSVKLRGGRLLDPRGADPFVELVRERRAVEADRSLPEVERHRRALFLKLLANTISYGLPARFDAEPRSKPINVEVAWPDREPEPAKTKRPERPGPFTFPPVAALVPAGARLTLALLEHFVREAGGELAACDTDGALIVASRSGAVLACPGGTDSLPDGTPAIRTLAFGVVEQILDRFVPLNCIVPGTRPWRVEHNALDSPLFAYVLGTKRHVLFRKVGDEFEIVKGLEHALGGIYLDPTADDADHPARGPADRHVWADDIWRSVLRSVETGEPPVFSKRFRRRAHSRFTISSKAMLDWYGKSDGGRPARDSMRPFNFGMAAHPDPMSADSDVVAITGYQSDPSKWDALTYIDRRTRRVIEGITEPRDPSGLVARPGDRRVRFRSVADIAEQWLLLDDPTHASALPHGSLPRGVLRRRPVAGRAWLTDTVGKEGTKIDAGPLALVLDEEDLTSTLLTGDEWVNLVLPVLIAAGKGRVTEVSGLPLAVIRQILEDRPPSPKHRPILEAVAGQIATAGLIALGCAVPQTVTGRLSAWLASAAAEQRTCDGCGKALTGRQKRWCADCARSGQRRSASAPRVIRH